MHACMGRCMDAQYVCMLFLGGAPVRNPKGTNRVLADLDASMIRAPLKTRV